MTRTISATEQIEDKQEASLRPANGEKKSAGLYRRGEKS